MAEQNNPIDVNYGRLQFDDPKSFIDYAVKLTQQIKSQYGAGISRVSYIRGTRKQQGNARISLNNLKEIKINDPKKEKSAAKLAHLVWALSQCGKIPAHIVFTDNTRNYELCTTHAKHHEGKLQKLIKEAMYTHETVRDNLPKALETGLTSILTRTVTIEQIKSFDDLPGEKKKLWREFAKYSTADGKITYGSFLHLQKELNITSEEVFAINEDYFGRRELDFAIDYGKVPFYQYHSETQELKKEIKRLEQEKKDLEVLLDKSKQ